MIISGSVAMCSRKYKHPCDLAQQEQRQKVASPRRDAPNARGVLCIIACVTFEYTYLVVCDVDFLYHCRDYE